MKLYLKHNSVLPSLWSIFCFVLLLLVEESLSESGICTRLETVEKTKTEYVYQTYEESYMDWCYRSYSYRQYRCVKYRTEGRHVPQTQTYTAQEVRQFCCSGYKSTGGVSDPLRCEPICNFPCVNSRCAAFDHCECNQGYSKQQGVVANNICEPVCSQPCIHGTCTAPETCTCRHGYSLDLSDRYTCRPVCGTPCVNAECTAPDTCTCTAGYLKVSDDPHKCYPRCPKPCLNAVCTRPEVCTCHVGYQKDDNSSTSCSPVCSHSCQNGTCTGPDECTCFDGFGLVGNYYSCEPVCTSCTNAFCSAPETCSCFPGYTTDPDDTLACLPTCSPACVNGNCTAPNSCECLAGYEGTEDPAVCKPYCSEGCENGVCTSPEECTCLWGFEGRDNSSICSPSTGVSHGCAFSNEMVNNGFDKTCFNLSGDLNLKGIKYCNILQELLAKHAEKLLNNSFQVNLNCNPVLELRITKNTLRVEIICDITIIDYNDEGTSNVTESITEFSTTDFTEISTEFDFSISSELFSTDEVNIDTTVFEESITNNLPADYQETTSDNFITAEKKPSQQTEFEILYDTRVERFNKMQLSKAPVNVNITAMFLPLIQNKLLTKAYFEDNATVPDQEWCLCHEKTIWTLCVNKPIKLFICPCKATITGSSLTNNSSSVMLTVLLLAAMIMLLVALAVLYATKRLKHIGIYSTRTVEENSGCQSRLSLESMGDSNGTTYVQEKSY